jgi:ABC-type multidrug transport system fused ATPase/permease subunit
MTVLSIWRDNAKLWREVFGLCWRRSRTMFLIICACLAMQTFLVAAIGVCLREVVSGTIETRVCAIVIGAVGAAVGYTASAVLTDIAFNLRIDLSELVAREHYDRQIQLAAMGIDGIEHLERTDYLDRLTALYDNTWAIGQSAWTAAETVALVVRLVLIMGLLGSVSSLMLIMLLTGVIPLVIEQRARRSIRDAERHRAQDTRLQRRLFEILTGAATGKEVRVAGSAEHLVRLQREAAERSERLWFRANLRAGLLCALGWSIFSASFVAGLATVVFGAVGNPVRLGDIVLIMTIGTQLRSVIEGVVRASATTGRAVHVLEPYRWLREYKAEHTSTGASPAPAELRRGITFENVTFAYPNSGRAALKGFSATLPAGSVIAIVGEYGSGKTTVLKLLEKMYRPDSGRILIDDTDLAEIDTRGWRAATSAAFQDFGRYHSTLAQGIVMGDLDRPDRLETAVAHADARGLVDRLPQGLDTQLGRPFGGVELSEGQWQKVALARASMREAPLLFVLDEPTASLDAPSEQAIFDRYMERARAIGPGGITIIVSHRFSTVAGADLILVLDAGRLIDCGPHSELLVRCPRYSELYLIQQGPIPLRPRAAESVDPHDEE